MKKKVLPINENPNIRTFSYYGFTNAIICNDYYTGSTAAKLKVKDFDLYTWKSVNDSLTLIKDEECMLFEAKDYKINMNACYYREVLNEDEIQIRIEYQQYSQPWGAINLFISDLCREEMMQDDNYICRIGMFNKNGLYIRICNVEQVLKRKLTVFPIDLKIKKRGNNVSFWAGHDDVLEKIFDYEIGECKRKMKIGFQVKLNDNVYYDWLFSNHIQLSGDIHDYDCKLRYYYGICKDYHYYTNNYFLDYQIIDIEEYKNYGIDILNFVKCNLNNNKYIEMWLDYFYVKGRSEYRKEHHAHQFLIYGYDDELEELMILGYTDNGILKLSKMKFTDFIKCGKDSYSTNQMIITGYNQDGRCFELNISHVAKLLKQYLEGYNSSNDISHLFTSESRKFGIKIYNELISEKGLYLLVRDRRISHILYEHKKCMFDRIDFLAAKGYLSESSRKNLSDKMNELLVLTSNIRNFCIKYMVCSKEALIEKIRVKLIELRDKDITYTKELYCCIVEENNLDIKTS